MTPFLAFMLFAPMVASSVTAGSPRADRLARLEALDNPSAISTETEVRALTPMQREIKAVLDSTRVRREKLVLDGAAAGEWPVELARLQRETRMQVLEIQERYARLEGRQDLVRLLQGTMAEVRRGRPAVN